MPLDADARAVLDRVRAAGIAPWCEQTVRDGRRVYERRIRLMDPRPIPVASVRDISVPGPAGELAARVYHPAPERRLPIVLYLHGGGWVLGSLDSHDWVCRELATTTSSVVVALDYRLAPEHPHPAALEDAYAAITWLARDGARLGGDPTRLVTAGDSAGGHLSAGLALLARDRGGPALRGQVLIYPSTEPDFETPSCLANANGYLLTRGDLIWFWGHLLGRSAPRGDATVPSGGASAPSGGGSVPSGGGSAPDDYAMPGRVADLSGVAPALVITAEFDPLHDDGQRYAGRLTDAGVPVDLHDYAGQIHGFVALPDAIPAGRVAVSRIATWLGGVFA